MNIQDKEQRKKLREICEAATPGEWEWHKSLGRVLARGVTIVYTDGNDAWFKDEDAIFITHAKSALPAALDYIEKLQREVKIALKTCPNGGNDGYVTPRPCQCEVESLEAKLEEVEAENKALFDVHVEHEAAIEENLSADRDYWKARAEALERVILNDEFNYEFSIACATCEYSKTRTCNYNIACKCNEDSHCNWKFDQVRFNNNKPSGQIKDETVEKVNAEKEAFSF